MFLALNQFLFLLPLMKTFGTVYAHMAVSFPNLLFVSRTYGTIRADMTPNRNDTDSALVFSISLFWVTVPVVRILFQQLEDIRQDS